MWPRGPGLFERLVGYAVLLVAVSVLLQEVARLVRTYAGPLGLAVAGILVAALISSRFYY